jgi:type IX secretion system PorP/SprF family membrane protein
MMRRKVPNMNKALSIAIPLMLAQAASGQQLPQYTMYMWNTACVNPAYAGSADMMTGSLLARKQWVGLKGSPSTQTFVLHTPLKERSLGAGLSVVHDQAGPLNTFSANFDISYRIWITSKSRLSFGLKGGFDQVSARLSQVAYVNENDPSFLGDVSGRITPNFGFGMYYWSEKGYVGLSAPRLLERSVRGELNGNLLTTIKERQHYFLIAGYVWPLSTSVKFKPTLLVKAVFGAPIQVDGTASFLMRDKLWLGAAYRQWGGSLSAFVAYNVSDQLRIGYAHDFALSAIRAYQTGTHEIMLNYDMYFNRQKARSPRYF